MTVATVGMAPGGLGMSSVLSSPSRCDNSDLVHVWCSMEEPPLKREKASFVKFEKHLRCGMNRARRRKGTHHHGLTNRLSREIVFSQKFRDQLLHTFLKRFSSQRGQLTFAISFINRNLISNILLLSNRETAPSGTAVSLLLGTHEAAGLGKH